MEHIYTCRHNTHIHKLNIPNIKPCWSLARHGGIYLWFQYLEGRGRWISRMLEDNLVYIDPVFKTKPAFQSNKKTFGLWSFLSSLSDLLPHPFIFNIGFLCVALAILNRSHSLDNAGLKLKSTCLAPILCATMPVFLSSQHMFWASRYLSLRSGREKPYLEIPKINE